MAFVEVQIKNAFAVWKLPV